MWIGIYLFIVLGFLIKLLVSYGWFYKDVRIELIDGDFVEYVVVIC